MLCRTSQSRLKQHVNQNPLPSSLWTFAGASSTKLKDVFAKSDITLTNLAQTTPTSNRFGKLNSAMNLQSPVGVLSSSIYSGHLAVSFFFRIKPIGSGNQMILTRLDANNDGQMGLYLRELSGKYYPSLWTGDTNALYDPPRTPSTWAKGLVKGEWVDVVVTFDSGHMTMYADKQLILDATYTYRNVNSKTWYFGRDARDGGSYLQGSISDLAVWNGIVLNSDQVKYLSDNDFTEQYRASN